MDFKELLAYQKAFELAMKIFQLSKAFPDEEKYSLTDQIRKSSRSVCANLAEAYRKRKYSNHFVSKLTDSDAEKSETNVWLYFACQCEYISKTELSKLTTENMEGGKLINFKINNPHKFGVSIT